MQNVCYSWWCRSSNHGCAETKDVFYTDCDSWWMHCGVDYAHTEITEEWECWAACVDYTMGYMANWGQEVDVGSRKSI